MVRLGESGEDFAFLAQGRMHWISGNGILGRYVYVLTHQWDSQHKVSQKGKAILHPLGCAASLQGPGLPPPAVSVRGLAASAWAADICRGATGRGDLEGRQCDPGDGISLSFRLGAAGCEVTHSLDPSGYVPRSRLPSFC